MFSNQEITESLPPVCDDEPPSLRQEIADEILDHLHCGLRRELLLNGGDENGARRRVLDKFGDPRQIARQLWHQAMWSKIMTQRLMIALSTLSVIVSVTLACMVGWMIHRQSQDNALLLDRIAKLSLAPTSPEPQRDLHWNNLKIKVALGSKDGPPAEGFQIDVEKVPSIGEVQGNASASHHAQLGNDGIEDCGFVGPGLYKLTVTAPWGESSEQSFTIYPGRDHTEICIAPEKIPDSAKVKVHLVGLPEENIESNTAFVCCFIPKGPRIVAGKNWSLQYSGWPGGDIRSSSIIFVPGEGLWTTKSGVGFFAYDSGTATKQATWEMCKSSLEVELSEYEYSVHFFLVKLANSVELKNLKGFRWQHRVMNSDIGGISNNYMVQAKFKADISQPNEWTISIPDVVLKCVKEETFLPQSPHAGGGMGGGFF